ncbi:hypothetical protein AVEN_98312-1 [Araneus ventricosus]|uniref:Uncharacterized protein n=1 Tax=Araneus ventricosus TaxID=182803 RepID=A0A4Y2T472_ARAVE|nr:hypothetical protein AVEN_98312-1 [Araneus ventricosus]
MCLELCRSKYSKATYGCDRGMTMIRSVSDLCIPRNFEIPHISDMQRRELRNKRLICTQNCKQGCLAQRMFSPNSADLPGQGSSSRLHFSTLYFWNHYCHWLMFIVGTPNTAFIFLTHSVLLLPLLN